MSVSCDAALKSLDNSSIVLSDSSQKLRAGKLVDVSQVIEHLKAASESARMLREAVLSELPDASWQNRDELDALLAKIRAISEKREAMQQLRSHLLALASALESGSIVHRRAQRLAELEQLRANAVKELQAHAAPQSEPPALPGPEADRWIEWACALKDPEDAESLQKIRRGFPHLDDFIANLEASMWTAGSADGIESGPGNVSPRRGQEEPRRSADEAAQPKQSWTRTGIESSQPAGTAAERDEARSSIKETSPSIQSTPQPSDSPPMPKGLALAQLMVMGRTGNPVGGNLSSEQRPVSATKPVCETTTPAVAAAQSESSKSMAAAASVAVIPEAEESRTSTLAESDRLHQEPVEPSAEWLAARFRPETGESPFPYELYGLSVATGLRTPEPASADRTEEDTLERSQERALARLAGADEGQLEQHKTCADASAIAAPVTAGARPGVNHRIDEAVQRPCAGRWLILLAAAFALLLAAGFLMFRGSRQTASNRAPKAVQGAPPAPAQSNSTDIKGPTSAATAPAQEARAPAPTAETQQQAKPQDHSVDRVSSTKVQPAKPAEVQQPAVLTPPPATQSKPVIEADTQGSAAASPNGVPNGMAKVLTDVPVVVPQKVVPQQNQDTSGLESAVLLRQVPPRYPVKAREARVEGTVVLEGVIGTDGKLQNLRVVRGDPRLVQAALDAAKQWRYKPSRLHGQPVESDTQININFSLTGG